MLKAKLITLFLTTTVLLIILVYPACGYEPYKLMSDGTALDIGLSFQWNESGLPENLGICIREFTGSLNVIVRQVIKNRISLSIEFLNLTNLLSAYNLFSGSSLYSESDNRFLSPLLGASYLISDNWVVDFSTTLPTTDSINLKTVGIRYLQIKDPIITNAGLRLSWGEHLVVSFFGGFNLVLNPLISIGQQVGFSYGKQPFMQAQFRLDFTLSINKKNRLQFRADWITQQQQVFPKAGLVWSRTL
jgi:hypothetical protein